MDVDLMERNGGNKRVHQRLSRGGRPSSSSSSSSGSTTTRVCTFWLEGRCNRHPCNFLHQNPQEAPHNNPHQTQQTQFRLHSDPNKKPHVWRNPSIGSSNANYSKWGSNKSYEGVGGGGGPPDSASSAVVRTSRLPSRKDATRVCNYFIKGTACKFGESCRFLHAWSTSFADDFSLLTPLDGHHKVITGIALPGGSDKLYSASKDGSVKVWDCQTGKCVADFGLGQEVGCLVGEESWVFVGIPNAVKAWNPQMGVDQTLSGPVGQVYALVVGNGFLFAGVQDGSILVWKVNATRNSFEPAASLSGHQSAVVSLVVGGMRLYSGSMDHTIRVWDLTNLQCLQTLNDHSDVVMSLLCWDQFLLSCSLDGTIKVWVATESGSLEVAYTHELEHGALKLSGMHDLQSKPILLCSYNNNTVYLYDLPSFAERGRLFSKEEVREITTAPGELGGLFFTGDGSGELKVWKWTS